MTCQIMGVEQSNLLQVHTMQEGAAQGCRGVA
jgi:hypothetical protein